MTEKEEQQQEVNPNVKPFEYHDDKPDGRPDLHVSTGPGDLSTFGSPLKPGS